MFPFLNENNECEDFFHIIGEQGQVMGQLDLKFKFEKFDINNGYKYSFSNINDNNYMINKKNNNTISYPLNNVFDKNIKKNNFMKTGNEGDLLHKRLEEAMNTVDDLTQILKNKVEKEQKENNNMNMNNINNSNNNEEEMIQNYNGEEEFNEIPNYNEEEEIQEQQYNEEEMEEGFEEQIQNEENNNNNIDNGNNIINNDINNNINNNVNNNNEFENKTLLTDYNNLNNSQKLSGVEEDNEKASFYSDTKEKDKKMKYLKNYDKNLLNKIQKIMKNKK